jgi:hypothetical protein
LNEVGYADVGQVSNLFVIHCLSMFVAADHWMFSVQLFLSMTVVIQAQRLIRAHDVSLLRLHDAVEIGDVKYDYLCTARLSSRTTTASKGQRNRQTTAGGAAVGGKRGAAVPRTPNAGNAAGQLTSANDSKQTNGGAPGRLNSAGSSGSVGDSASDGATVAKTVGGGRKGSVRRLN